MARICPSPPGALAGRARARIAAGRATRVGAGRCWGRALAAWGLAWLAAGCGDELVIKGTLDRVVGQPLTVALTEGKPTFADSVALIDAGGVSFGAAELRSKLVSPRELSCVVPTAVRVGRAQLRLGKQGTSGRYVVPLTISRLAVVLDDAGALQTLPVSGSVVAASRLPTGSATSRMSLAPGGGQLAVLAPQDPAPRQQLQLYAVASPLRLLQTLDLDAGTAVAATDDGALVARPDALTLYRLDGGNGLQVVWTLQQVGVKALAVDAAGRVAVALAGCDGDGDAVLDRDCVLRVPLDSDPSVAPPPAPTLLDNAPSAALIALRADGQAAVIPDSDVVYGVLFDGPAPRVVSVPWDPGPALPSSIDHTASNLGEIFAISDQRNGVVFIVGFDAEANNQLKVVLRSQVLGVAPVALSFARRTELYVASARAGIFGMDLATGEITEQALLNPAGQLNALVIQH